MRNISKLPLAKQISIRKALSQDGPCVACAEVIPRDCKVGFHVDCKREVVLFRRGDYPENIFVVCKGSIKLSISSKRGNNVIVRLASPGDVLGLSAVIVNRPYEVTAESVGPCLLRVLPGADVLRTIAENGRASHCITESLARQHQSEISAACEAALSNSVAGRVATVLLKLQQAMHDGRTRSAFPLLLTHTEIAEMVRTTRESVSRSMMQLRRDGVIAVKRGEITLLRQELLEEMAS